jgi:DNA invertase Pin-like site-specific DNA recombinase
MEKNGARVYSYLRFSDPRQSTGSSADRQRLYAQAWAAERGLVLDESLTLRDEGLSAYHQRHIKQGALGVFLQAVSEGRIPEGSVLIVEGLDRLSRAEPIQAQAQLAQIINAGITVVTASDGREYNRAGLKAQPMDLVYSLLVMIRAHEESDTKSKRVKASIRRLCEAWQAGTYRGRVRNGNDPSWVEWTGSEWRLIPERVEAVRLALHHYKNGLGAGRAAKLMYQQGHAITDQVIAGQQIYRLIRLPALRGAKRISIDGDDYMLEGYYPRLLSEEEWHELQHLAGQRKRRRGAGEIPGIITGVGLTYCGYCGTALVAQNIMGRNRKPDGALQDGHRRLQCVSSSHGTGCRAGGSCSVVPVERALLTYCSDQINLARLHDAADDGSGVRAQLAAARTEAEKLQRQLDKVTDALLADDSGAAPLSFVRKARELETQLKVSQESIQQLEHMLSATQAGRVQPAAAERWANLAARVFENDFAAREEVRQLVMDTFERLVIYMRGVGAEDRSSQFIDLMMVPKRGRPRAIRINRKTGIWGSGEDYAVFQ